MSRRTEAYDNELYYRIMFGRDGKVCYPCMQQYDESDYDSDDYITDEIFDTEADAKAEYARLHELALRILRA